MSGHRVSHGWRLLFHPAFLEPYRRLARQVELLKERHPDTYHSKAVTKRLAALERLVYELIPEDPSRSEYRLGDALGRDRRHWFRAKFFQQYRLFFRFHAASRLIVYGWVNDETSKRAYESDDDAYLIFQRMLKNRFPPDDWELLLHQASGLPASGPR